MSEQSRIELEARRRDVEDFAWLRAENERLRALLKRISEWDALSGTVAPYGDGPYWRREIANALGGTTTTRGADVSSSGDRFLRAGYPNYRRWSRGWWLWEVGPYPIIAALVFVFERWVF